MKTQRPFSPALIASEPQWSSEKKKPTSGMLYRFLLAAMGFGGTLFALLTLYTPDCRKLPLLLSAAACFLLASVLQLLPKHSGKLTVFGILLLLLLPILRARQMVMGMQHIINQVYQNAHHTDVSYFTLHASPEELSHSATLTCICVAGLLAFFFACFTLRKPHFVLTACVSFLLIEPGLYLGLPVNAFAMAFLLAYWCGMLALRFAMLNGHRKAQSHQRAASVRGSVTAGFVLLVYSAVALTGTWQDYTRTDADKLRMQELSASLAEFDVQNLPQSIRNIGTALGLSASGTVSLGTKASLQYRDRTDLKLIFDNLPDSTMYLKGYTGSVYQNNSWSALTKASDFQNGSTVFSVLQNYDCAPQNFPFLFQRSMLPDSGIFACTVQPLRRDGRYYQPYASFGEQVSFPDDANIKPKKRSTYRWTVSAPQSWVIPNLADNPLQDCRISASAAGGSDAVRSFLDALGTSSSDPTVSIRFQPAEAADSPEMIQGKTIPAALLESLAYRDFAADAYTELPESDALDAVYAALPESLQNSHPRTVQEQYQALCEIRAWMAENTTYTLSPGKTPKTRDFVSFFLLENQKGYCVHYATAGTILARHLGIPARYCEGYLVGNDVLDSASVSGDGYTVTLKDRQAHAWCEFYIDGYGWMPFEMTPGYYDSMPTESAQHQTSTNAVTETTVSETLSQEMTSASLTSTKMSSVTTASGTGSVPGGTESESSSGLSGSDGNTAHVLHTILRILLYLLAAAAVIAAVILLRRWHLYRRRKRFCDTLHPRQAIQAMYRYLFRLLRWTGLSFHQEALLEFCETAQQHLRQKHLPDEAPLQIIPMTLALEFGRQFPEKAQQLQAAENVEALANAFCASCRPLKRLCLKYLFHLF